MSRSRRRQRRLAAAAHRTKTAKPQVEQLEGSDLPSTAHFLASMIHLPAANMGLVSVGVSAVGSVTPTDPRYASQWDLKDIGAPKGWTYTTGTTRTTVAVIDTGIDYNHQDLYDN